MADSFRTHRMMREGAGLQKPAAAEAVALRGRAAAGTASSTVASIRASMDKLRQRRVLITRIAGTADDTGAFPYNP